MAYVYIYVMYYTHLFWGPLQALTAKAKILVKLGDSEKKEPEESDQRGTPRGFTGGIPWIYLVKMGIYLVKMGIYLVKMVIYLVKMGIYLVKMGIFGGFTLGDLHKDVEQVRSNQSI